MHTTLLHQWVQQGCMQANPVCTRVVPGLNPCVHPNPLCTTPILYWDTNLTEEPDLPGTPILQSNRCPSTGYGPKPPVLGLYRPIWAPNHPNPVLGLHFD